MKTIVKRLAVLTAVIALPFLFTGCDGHGGGHGHFVHFVPVHFFHH